jgi:hydrogenase-4 component B
MADLILLVPAGILIATLLLGLAGKGRTSLYLSNILSAISSLSICYVAFLGFKKSLELKFQIYSSSSIVSSLNWLILRVDSLSAFFLLILGVLGFCASLYGIKYMEHYLNKGNVKAYNFNYPIFLLTMYLVLISWDLLWFIIFWELMSFFSQFLVAFERSNEKAIKAAFKYFYMTKAGAEFLVLTIVAVTLKVTNFNANYSEIARLLPLYLQSNPSTLYFLTFALLIGFGVKAAMIPLHSWLPDAHPEAPSNVSALLSGAMIKLPIYMLFRFFLTFFPKDTSIGLIIAFFGAITLFFSIMYALLQDDSKRLLAFSSIDNIGYILLPFGAGLYLIAIGNEFLGAVALIASLYHTINHAFFKGLLFLTAGSVAYETGSRDLNYLGGLAKQMPLTAFTALIGSLSIAGMPPLNGFVSKWLIYVSTLSTPATSLFGIIALFISAVTLAAFVKYFTTIFTRPPLEEIKAKEVPFLMWSSQMLLALLCILFGVYPFLPLKLTSSALNSVGVQIELAKLTIFPSIVVPKTGSFSPIIIFAFLLIATAILVLLIPTRGKEMSTWSCGSKEKLNARIPSNAYYMDFKEEFSEVYKLGDSSKALMEKALKFGRKLGLRFEVLSYNLDSMLFGAMLLIVLLVILLGGVSL